MTPDEWRVPVWARAARWLVPAVVVAYGVTLLPGIRGGSGPHFVAALEIGVGDGVIALGALLCLARAVLVGRDRWAWVFIGLGPLLYVAGDLYYYVFLDDLADPPYPSVADALWLALYPCLIAGLVLLVGSSLRGVRATLWLDGLTGGFGAAALLGAVVLRPVLAVTGGDLATVLTNLAYPVCDLALLTVLMLVFNLQGWRPGPTWWLLGFMVVALLVSDSVYLLQAAAGTYVDAGVLDVGWAVAFSVLGAAAWATPQEARAVRYSRASLAVPAVLSVLSTIVLFAGAMQTLPLPVAVFGLLAILLGSLRLAMALLESWRLVVARLEARTDELTGLPNRRRFLELLEAGLDTGEATAVMIVDLDRFKQVNDSLGHNVGDRLLQVIGARLEGRVRTEDTVVARLGGDEFAVIVTGQAEEVVYTIAARMREVICDVIELSGVPLTVDASVGIALAPRDGVSGQVLMSKADAAMYVAKRTGTGVEFYAEQRDDSSVERLSLLAELRVALSGGGLDVHFQPVYSLHDGALTSVEALVRWPHPKHGLLAPADFLPVATEAGLSRQLTDEVLRIVTQQAADWRAAGHVVPVAVNLSEADLADNELAMRIATACEHADLPSDLLQLEVTESIAVSVIERAAPMLASMRERGHALLLDDFGTGYSSLAVLRDLPLDVLKLDRSFLADLDRPAARTIVQTTVEMAHRLGLQIVAEGVETAEVLEVVRGLGCDGAQGFLLHRPAAAGDVSTAFARNSSEGASSV